MDQLYVVGGDGTLRGAAEICEEIARRGLRKSIIGIPKTIDNDIQFIDKSFGFETAFAEAVKAVQSAHAESQGSPNGIGLVKLMGRDSGFITSFATLAGSAVNFALIPEVPFQLEGARGTTGAPALPARPAQAGGHRGRRGRGAEPAQRPAGDRRLGQPKAGGHRTQFLKDRITAFLP